MEDLQQLRKARNQFDTVYLHPTSNHFFQLFPIIQLHVQCTHSGDWSKDIVITFTVQFTYLCLRRSLQYSYRAKKKSLCFEIFFPTRRQTSSEKYIYLRNYKLDKLAKYLKEEVIFHVVHVWSTYRFPINFNVVTTFAPPSRSYRA